MSEFGGMEDLLQDFLVEAGDMLSGVDNKLVDLERSPDDRGLLNDIFRGFHTIKGGAGFLNATELVTLCHLTESLFDKLRNGELSISAEAMDVILGATSAVREMFGYLEHRTQPPAADPALIEGLRATLAGGPVAPAPSAVAGSGVQLPRPGEPDWELLHAAVTGKPVSTSPAPRVHGAANAAQASSPIPVPAAPAPGSPEALIKAAVGRRSIDAPGGNGPIGRREGERQRDNSIRVDTARLDQVLNLSGEIGLTKNRLNALRSDILSGRNDT